jgi:methylamine utilization protein MauE
MTLGALGLVAGLLLAVVFAVAGIAKLADRAGTRTAVGEFGVPQGLVGLFALVLPLAELTVAALLLPGPTRAVGGAGAVALLGLFSAAIVVSLARGRAPDCDCFGQLHSASASWRTLMRNGLLAGLAALALSAGIGGETPSAVTWIGDLSGVELLVSATAVAVLALAAGGVLAFLSLLRSYGSVLLRLETIERQLDPAVGEGEEQGLSVGSPAPELSLLGLDGAPVSLAGRADTETLVLFWNPDCGFCSSMRDDLLTWERHTPPDAPRLLVVSSGDDDSTRAEGFSSTVVLDPDFGAGAVFGARGTPMAVLLDRDGRVASPLAAGAEAVFALAGGRAPVEYAKEGVTP